MQEFVFSPEYLHNYKCGIDFIQQVNYVLDTILYVLPHFSNENSFKQSHDKAIQYFFHLAQ